MALSVISIKGRRCCVSKFGDAVSRLYVMFSNVIRMFSETWMRGYRCRPTLDCSLI